MARLGDHPSLAANGWARSLSDYPSAGVGRDRVDRRCYSCAAAIGVDTSLRPGGSRRPRAVARVKLSGWFLQRLDRRPGLDRTCRERWAARGGLEPARVA